MEIQKGKAINKLVRPPQLHLPWIWHGTVLKRSFENSALNYTNISLAADKLCQFSIRFDASIKQEKQHRTR